MHEVCLSVMITNVKHPLVFFALVFSDVTENSFCLWSLYVCVCVCYILLDSRLAIHCSHRHRSTQRLRNAVVPDNDNTPATTTTTRQNSKQLKRTSSVFRLVQNPSMVREEGTSLFIASTLLVREMVETVVPIQACAVLLSLYALDIKTNSLVIHWTHDDMKQAMMYIGIDLCVEIVVFSFSIFCLKLIYPQYHAGTILCGLVRTYVVDMLMISLAVWICNLMYQSTYSGMDLTFRFKWIDLSGDEERVWLGGFDWCSGGECE
jgi:hypothetical protein